MKYVLNNGRYAIAFAIQKDGKEVKIAFDRRRVFLDTGNVATTGITQVEDADFEELKKIKRFANMLKAKELVLTEKSQVETAETKVNVLEQEVAELKAKLAEKPETKNDKALKEKDKEIADLKSKLEALTKTEDKKDETEGF